jgi:AcrR family transcriptional regulator
MPRLWTDTIEEHRTAVRDAALDATAALIADQGLRGVTMSRVAQRTGVGRATLYKYFVDVDALLLAWHERQIQEHLVQLNALREGDQPPDETLRAVLERYALLQHQQQPHAGSETAAQLHRGGHVAQARSRLHEMVSELIAEAAAAGCVRSACTD